MKVAFIYILQGCKRRGCYGGCANPTTVSKDLLHIWTIVKYHHLENYQRRAFVKPHEQDLAIHAIPFARTIAVSRFHASAETVRSYQSLFNVPINVLTIIATLIL